MFLQFYLLLTIFLEHFCSAHYETTNGIFTFSTRRKSLKKYFYGYTLFTASPKRIEDVEYIKNLKLRDSIDMILFDPLPKNRDLNFTHANNIPFMVSFKLSLRNEQQRDLEEEAGCNNVEIKTVAPQISDILYEQVIDDKIHTDRTRYEHYHSQENIYQWMQEMNAKFPNATQLYSIGLTSEMREIYVLIVKYNEDPLCPAVILEGGVHGNEWLSTAFVTFFLDQLLTNQKSKTLLLMKQRYCWHFIPILNPDGYVYSQEQDFLWRRNRNASSFQYRAVDINRNFNYKFGVFDADCNVYNDRWPGSKPFSESESNSLRAYLTTLGKQIVFYYSIHGYGQKFLIPFADSEAHEKNYDEVANLARNAARIIFLKTGNKYHVGTAWETLGVKWSGDSASWVKRRFNPPFVMTLLLRDTGTYGLVLPREEIIDACKEMTEGIVVMMTREPKKMTGNIFEPEPKSGSAINSIGIVFILVFILLIDLFY